jgi:hypothetical protein
MEETMAKSLPNSSLHKKKIIWLECQTRKRKEKAKKVGGK